MTTARWFAPAVMVLAIVAAVRIVEDRPAARAESSPLARAAVTVQTLAVQARQTARNVKLSGTLCADRIGSVATRLSGRITALAVAEGDTVTAGQVLVRIDTSNIEAQASQAQAGVAVAQASAVESADGVAHATSAIAVASAERAAMRARLAEAEAAQRQAQVDRHRTAELFEGDAVSRADFDRADSALRMASARVKAAQAGIRQAEAEEARVRIGVEQSRAAASRSDAAIAVARSSVRVAESDIPYGTLRAPFDGVVTRKLAQAGDLAVPGRTLLQIDDVTHLHLDLDVPEDIVASLPIGLPVRVRVDGVMRPIEGRIYQVVRASDPQSRSVIVKIRVNATSGLMPGLFGQVEVAVGRRRFLSVPRAAVVQRGQLTSVFAVDRDSIARLRLVKTVPHGEEVEVVAGLSAGDIIVRNPPPGLTDGTPLQFEKRSEGQ